MSSPSSANSLPIRIEAVSKNFDAFVALDAVDLDIAAGEFVTLLGPSGSGKTTLLNVLAGFLRPERGQVFFGDRDVTVLAPHQRNVGVVFQNYALFPHMSVAENVAFPLRARRVPRVEIEARVARALDLVQLTGFGARRVDQLSGGQRQRVALARAVVFEPKIIFMDEPLSALDKQLRELMQIELRQLHAKLGATTVYVTHDQREALTMSDRVAVLNHGRIVQVDSPQRIYERPADSFVAEFVGESTLLPVRRNGPASVILDGLTLSVGPAMPDGEELLLVLRSESLQFAAECADTANRLPVTVLDVVYQGDSVILFGKLAGGRTVAMRRIARADALGNLPRRGEQTVLAFDPGQTVLVSA